MCDTFHAAIEQARLDRRVQLSQQRNSLAAVEPLPRERYRNWRSSSEAEAP
jgi:hypothetical protein